MMQVEDRIVVQSRRAAKSALVMWFSGQWTRQVEALDDLHQDLLVWYAETVSAQNKMSSLSDPEIMVTFRIHARQILSKNTHDYNRFTQSGLYSTEAVRAALRKESKNKYLYNVIPVAMQGLSNSYKSALYDRYENGIVPKDNDKRNVLKRAVRAITDEINVIYLTTDSKTIGSKAVIFPDSAKPKGGHGDPTAGIALTLMEQHPDVKDEYLYESPWEQINQGAAAEPVIEFGPSKRYRLTAEEAKLFRRVPGLIELFIEQKQKEWGRV